MNRRIVTIYTDASHDHRLMVAGWGGWIKADGGAGVTAYGETKARIRSSGEAELAAMAYALREAQRTVGVGPGDIVVFVTDSAHAQRRMQGYGKRSDLEQQIISYILTTAQLGGFRLRTNKVKGHSTHDGVRSGVNGLVDRLARKGLRTARYDSETLQ